MLAALSGKYEDLEEVLIQSATEIKLKAHLTDEQAHQCLLKASQKFLQLQKVSPSTALQIWKESNHPSAIRRMTLGDVSLDRFLKGGIPSKGLIEISGESATGKTQLCLQLALAAQLPLNLGGLEGAVAYVSTEGGFPMKRLRQLIPHFVRKYECMASKDLTSSIYLIHSADLDDLEKLISSQLPSLLEQKKVRLVIIDSFAAIFRVEFEGELANERSKYLSRFGSKLKKLSDQYDTPIVCVNQVSDNFASNGISLPILSSSIFNSNSSNQNGKSQPQPVENSKVDTNPATLMAFPNKLHPDSNLARFVPTLGLVWANTINLRIMLHRSRFSSGQGQDANASEIRREMEIIFAPHLPMSKCEFIVTEAGVIGTSWF